MDFTHTFHAIGWMSSNKCTSVVTYGSILSRVLLSHLLGWGGDNIGVASLHNSSKRSSLCINVFQVDVVKGVVIANITNSFFVFLIQIF